MQTKLYRQSNGAKERQKTAFISVKNQQVKSKPKILDSRGKKRQRILSCGRVTKLCNHSL